MASWDNSNADLGDVPYMTADILYDFLTEDLKFLPEDMKELKARQVDGEAFVNLSREDIATIFPEPSKFVMGSKLYRAIQRARTEDSGSTQELIDELSEAGRISSPQVSGTSSSRSDTSGASSIEIGRKRSSISQPPTPKRSKEKPIEKVPVKTSTAFRLPVFSPDVKKAIQDDAFYSTSKRNKLIKEACIALRGFCWSKGQPVSNEQKKTLAKMLLDQSPNSLGDARSSKGPEAGLYGQIVKWFQNHSYMDRKACGEVKAKGTHTGAVRGTLPMEDDTTAVQLHLRELEKECMNDKVSNPDKVARLLSLTHTARQDEMAKWSAAIRPSETLKKFSVLQRPNYLVQEMFHVMGLRFETCDEVKKKLQRMVTWWELKFIPVMLAYGDELDLSPPESDDSNVLAMYVLSTLTNTLKPKGSKGKTPERLESIIIFAQSVDEGLKKAKGNLNPFVLCVGTPGTIHSSVLICNMKVVTVHIAKRVLACLVTLLSAYYTYNLEYNPKVREVLEFLQEKLLGDSLGRSRKTSKAFDQLYRSIDCIQRKLQEADEEEEETDQEENDPDNTQGHCDF